MEYERLKREREEKEQKDKDQVYENLTSEQESQILKGNPIMDSSYSLKKRWYEETPFRGQSLSEPKDKKRFINDTVRSDFHKTFLKKFIWT
jgi:protein CWC15